MSKNIWTDELRKEAVDMYLERIAEYDEDKQSAFSTEVVAGIAEELQMAKNSVRVILQKATRPDGTPVYIKAKAAPKAKAAGATSGAAGKKVSKADAHAELVSALKDHGAEVSDELMEVIEKMTGKAAQLIAEAIRSPSAE
ncbi:hypothetical protein [Vibrio phage JSF12]|uniref:D3 protein n=3 Tax=Jesfedecavirus TaxID=2560156 RepID=A0A2D0Z1I1_9CAUD|nr:DNA binding protein [Vibrio phage phi 3]YP_009618460.1 DNA binding protein [Vibrio phage JSF10]YP_009794831.1 DNA binding protein [Vibrio phage JSF12]AJF40867.1 D3 protein [Vibrio phage phi 3]ASV43433.1 hypothetical protein [Vibrio phage JSF10]ASV43666.1 hypothetical protein [Vibrio phage JSF12]